MRSIPLSEHRVFGDGSTAALVRCDGAVDWWCTPRFDASPVLWSLLDPAGAESGYQGVEPVEQADVPAGATAKTTVRAACGTIELWDGLVDGRLVRLARCRDGALNVFHKLSLGGFEAPWIVRHQQRQLLAAPGAWVGLQIDVTGTREVAAEPLREMFRCADEAFAASLRGVRLPRRHVERAEHALAVFEVCTYRPTGATVASPTASVPEAPGYDRQFDYRYAWLRDNALAASIAALVGQIETAARSLRFLCSLDSVFAAPLFAVTGAAAPEEREVTGVHEYDGSAPIRVGNAAKGQQQYDALGAVVEAISVFVRSGGRLDADLWGLVTAIADRMCDAPTECTNGIWELRDARPLVSADLGRWLALDRAIRLGRVMRPLTPRRRWVQTRAAIRGRILGALRYDGHLPQAYGGAPHDLDASALFIPMFGLLDRRDVRVHRLIDVHLAALGDGPFLYRYDPAREDGFGGRESAFVPCSWWAVSALAAVGRLEEAQARADDLCRALPILIAEEFDPADCASRGNVPLLWSHMEVVRALHALDLAELRQRGGPALVQLSRLAELIRARVVSRRPATPAGG